MTTNNRVALYARVSTDVQAETNYSLDTQLDALRLYAATNALRVVDEFKDDYTGRSLSRPDLNRLMKLAASKAIDTVVVFSVDRASRNAFNILKLTDDLKSYGVGVKFLDFDYEDSPLGRLLLYIKGFTAESEADQFKERSKRGKRKRISEGQPLPGIAVPYGYKYVSQRQADGKKGGQWEINEQEAALVLRIFAMYADEGLGTVAIANRLNAEGLKPRENRFEFTTRRGYRGVWSPSTILCIVSNEAYTGIAYYGKTRREVRRNPETGKEYSAKVQQPRDLWQAFTVPALITQETFDKAQQRRKTNNKVSQRNTPVTYWLRGVVRCTNCGMLMHAFTRWRDKVRIYQCPGQTRHHSPDGLAPTCRFSIRADDLESRVWASLVERLSDPAQLLQDYQAQLEQLSESRHKLEQELAQVNTRLAESNDQLRRLLDQVIAGNFPLEMVADKTKAIQQLIEAYTAEKTQIDAKLTQQLSPSSVGKVVDYLRAGAKTAYQIKDPTAKRALIERLGLRALIHRNNAAKTYTIEVMLEISPASIAEPLHVGAEILSADQQHEQDFQGNPSPDPDETLPPAHEYALLPACL